MNPRRAGDCTLSERVLSLMSKNTDINYTLFFSPRILTVMCEENCKKKKKKKAFPQLCLLNPRRVTEALLLYDCEEGGHVPSVDARVQGMLGKVVKGRSLVQ